MNDKPIDELVAEKVMEWIKPPETSILKAMWVETPVGSVHPQLPKFSENMQDAWLVVEKFDFANVERVTGYGDAFYRVNISVAQIDGTYSDIEVKAPTAPMAICIAALKAVGEEWQ
ncbi:BC1872 family protein [Bacillus cereus group sp. BY105LC]|uniref:BC1872 family protein n=1 Tax=Bacillus cereus group sp. BY105LC TaxID=3018088 RepID=UPI0022E82997|nr:hypothetical protein [Bacillus cereus group sp. BY105LC]MDA1883092.1 hypothetical protein [Bacillus cereus group sp. BY105LC]